MIKTDKQIQEAVDTIMTSAAEAATETLEQLAQAASRGINAEIRHSILRKNYQAVCDDYQYLKEAHAELIEDKLSLCEDMSRLKKMVRGDVSFVSERAEAAYQAAGDELCYDLKREREHNKKGE